MSRVNKSDVLGLLEEHGAIVSGHFELLSGLHSPTFIRTAVVLQYPYMAQKFASAICSKFPQKIDAVLAASEGALIIGVEVAKIKRCRSISAERTLAGMSLKRDFHLDRGERVLVIQDVVTTGRATSEAISLVLAYGARVAGVASVVDRSSAPIPLRVPFRPLICYPARVYRADSCPLCERGTPLVRTTEERGKRE